MIGCRRLLFDTNYIIRFFKLQHTSGSLHGFSSGGSEYRAGHPLKSQSFWLSQGIGVFMEKQLYLFLFLCKVKRASAQYAHHF